MTDTIQFELVSPEKRLMSKAVEMVVLPGSEGDLGILPGHAPLITALRPGVIVIHENGQQTEQIFTASGFVEVRPDRLIVLAQKTLPVASLNRDEIEREIRDLGEDLTDAKDDAERESVTEELAVAQAKLAAAA